MTRPCYALSALLTAIAGFSCMVAPATGKAPKSEITVAQPLCLVVEPQSHSQWTVFAAARVDGPANEGYDGCEFCWDEDPLANATGESQDDQELCGWVEAAPTTEADDQTAPTVLAAQRTDAARASSEVWREEYAPYETGCEALGAGLACWSHPVAESATARRAESQPHKPERAFREDPRCMARPHCLLGRAEALWESEYAFDFDEYSYELAGDPIDDAEPALAERSPAPTDRPPAPRVVQLDPAAQARQMEEAWSELALQYEEGEWLASEQAVADAALAETSPDPVAHGGERDTDTAIDQAVARAWDEVDALYEAWRASERESAATWWVASVTATGGERLRATCDPQKLGAAWERIRRHAGLWMESQPEWTRMLSAVDRGLRQQKQPASDEPSARQGVASLLRNAAIGFRQASQWVDSLADACEDAGQTHEASPYAEP